MNLKAFFAAFLPKTLLIVYNQKIIAMSFGGAVSAMITSLKNNKRNRVSTFEKIEGYETDSNTKLHFDKSASQQQLNQIKNKIQKENQLALIKRIIFFILFLATLTYLIYF
ncbi:hypothetical protein [Tenacibaculum aiptasiae]|uniref:hypothetical protein n=1 Tax=Tenacibaculum aiptasiae TaxID=426481 RepID=UPI0024904EA1|nr:hypothetical protein [Tenacibaculum aiptasiae]